MNNEKRLIELYDQGLEKLRKEMCFEDVLDQLRDMDIFLKDTLFDDKTKFLIKYDDRKVISLDINLGD